MADRINFSKKINSLAQVGDTLYFTTYDVATGTTAPTPVLVGNITQVGEKHVVVNTAPANVTDFESVFFLFAKPDYNNTSLKGYFQSVKIETNLSTKTELFALGTEVSESSK